jgi:predicted transcriptional regulator
MFVGGPGLDLSVQGWVRLPLAAGAPACGGCLAPQNQTLWAEGDLTLQDLRPGPDKGTMLASLGGDVAQARLDEKAVDGVRLFSPPGLGVTGAVAVAGVGLAAVWRLLAAFFSRMHDERDVLASSRRRAVLALVQARPGIHLRALSRELGVSTATVRHHLRHLFLHGLVVEAREGNRMAIYDAKTSRPAPPLEVLQDREMRRLHGWLEAEGGMPVASAVRHAMQAWGWSRSTAYHRLGRLVATGLAVQEMQEGRPFVGPAAASP